MSPRLAVIGTAGHIDHGKTAMVRRLTGVDTDRLPEEKKRGISIDLGFAPLVTPAGARVGMVDVPGHERFVKNMLAGVGGVDLVLLVIAADEGVMPQTREHFAIVKLLGIARGVIVLTKCDLVEGDWLAEVSRDARTLVQGSALAEAPIVAFSAVTGVGESELLAEIDRQLASATDRETAEPARLPIDRVFTVEGFGTVVTGTLWRGAIRAGDTLGMLPQGASVRVRRVQVHGATVEEARAGQRTAVALHGIERETVTRGDWLAAQGSLTPSHVLDVRFELLGDMPREWPANTRVRFHLGASEIIGRLVLLEGEGLAPGGSAFAQLRLEKPAVATRGDRFVIRQYSPSRTIGGGSVINPVAEKRRRHDPGLESLAVHESGSLEARLLEQLEKESRPTSAEALARTTGAGVAEAAIALARLAAAHELVVTPENRYVAESRWDAARGAIEREVRTFTAAHPGRYGVMKGELKSGIRAGMETALFDAAFAALIGEGVIAQQGEHVRPADTPWEPPAQMTAALESVERTLEATGYLVPENAAWQSKLGARAGEVAALGFFMGRLVRVSQDLTYTQPLIERLRETLAKWFANHAALTVANFRDLTGASRKYAVPL
ncbi:MAG: selenocysteine-specific translation elongation factor, partial [Candidatus Eisenbacteria bacterium]|nr:selenocysteine-specific translation elongation factor [Candidatus Eisenbacteria bacterium]